MVKITGLELVPYGVFDHEEVGLVQKYLDCLYRVIKNHHKVVHKDFPYVYLWGIGTSGLSLCLFAKRHIKEKNPEISVFINPLDKRGVSSHRKLPNIDKEGLNILLDDCIETGKTVFDVQRRFGYTWDILFVSGEVKSSIVEQLTNFKEIYIGKRIWE